MRQLDVLFVIPGDLRQVYQGLAPEHAIEPPAFARLAAAHLLGNGVSVELIDVLADGATVAGVAEDVHLRNPRLVVVPVYGSQPSASTQTMPAARSVCQAMKDRRSDIPILMFGTHPAALPERTLREEPIDFVCDGEGPTTIHDLLRARAAGEGLDRVRSLCRLVDGTFVRNPPALLLSETELNQHAPAHAWHLTPPSVYRAHDWHAFYRDVEHRTPYASILTTLGCPFACTFCCIQEPFRVGQLAMGKSEANTYRRFDPEAVIQEIEILVERYGVTLVKFHDEMFVLHPRHVETICRLIRERYGDRLNIWAYARVDTTKPRFLEMLRGAGFRWLGIGIEAASSNVRDGQDKSFTDADIRKTIAAVEAAGINVGANYIFGLPGDTHASMEDTLQLAMELNTPYANFYCNVPYPGSPEHRDAQAKGSILAEDPGGPGWIGYSQHAYETFPMGTESLAPADVLAFRDAAVHRYYAREEYRAKISVLYGAHCSETLRNIQRNYVEVQLHRALLEKRFIA